MKLCDLDWLRDGEARGLMIDTQKIVLVRDELKYHAYRNSCPHQGVPLDWDNDQFLSFDGDMLQCSAHAALFIKSSGECVSGPCAGQALSKIKIKQTPNGVFLDDELT